MNKSQRNSIWQILRNMDDNILKDDLIKSNGQKNIYKHRVATLLILYRRFISKCEQKNIFW